MQLNSRADQLRTLRTEHTVEAYTKSAYSEAPPKPYNCMQSQTGFDITHHMRGKVPYSSLQIIHIPYIRDELSLRGVDFDNDWSIKKLALALKNNDVQLQKQDIVEKAGNTNPKESELNLKTFLPIHRNADEYDMNRWDIWRG